MEDLEKELLLKLMSSLDGLRQEISSLRVDMSRFSGAVSTIDNTIESLKTRIISTELAVVEVSKVCSTCEARRNIGNLSTFGRWAGVVVALIVSIAAMGQSLNLWGGGTVVNVGGK